MSKPDGLGVEGYQFAFCINNRPDLDDYSTFSGIRPLRAGELQHIVSQTSNHWRKLFNVFAKCLYEIGWPDKTGLSCATWQEYRDHHLLQSHSSEALLFSPPQLNRRQMHVVAGKTYGQSLPWSSRAMPLTEDIFVFPEHYALISPYLDYRQLTNQKIVTVAGIAKNWLDKISSSDIKLS